jgi:hypothetical protein
MNPQDRGESNSERRREPLAGRIGEALDAMDLQNAGDCPDGEILAAYAERGLALEETAKWEGHFAACSRCRKILLVLDASAGTPLAEKDVSRLGELAAVAPASGERARSISGRAQPWLADWRVHWLAPAVGVAAVLAVLLVLRPPQRGPQQAASETLVAQAPKQDLPLPSEPAGADRFSRAGPSQPQELQSAPRLGPPSSLEPAPLNSPAASLAKGGAEIGSAADKTLPFEAGKKKFSDRRDTIELQAPSSSASSSNSLASQGAMSSPAVPPPPAKTSPNMAAGDAAQLDAGANSVARTASREKQAVAPQGAPAPNASAGSAMPQIPSEARLDERKEQAFALVRPVQKDSPVLKAPAGSTLWRVGSRGSIERSTDAGKTWASQASPSREDWLAGAAVSDAVCWLVGRRGAIARTLDGGEHWTSIDSPQQPAGPNAVAADWTGIAAADAQTATITAGDGRKFATADGGKTWQQQSEK